jgi:hypothetical protein
VQAGVGESCRGYCKNNGYDCDEEVQTIPCSVPFGVPSEYPRSTLNGYDCDEAVQTIPCVNPFGVVRAGLLMLAYVVVDSPAAQSPPASTLACTEPPHAIPLQPVR